jgi:peroxiredoxin
MQRSTFVIDPEGKLTKVWKTVKPENHAVQVLSAIREREQSRSSR